ncbi:ABC transporter substrate-binding protein [Treponema socranskii]|uniref:ABC transporter substrate-binding protein n=1 Tax=Treponema socranskii TaxID=53419 RepID=UPI003D8D122E
MKKNIVRIGMLFTCMALSGFFVSCSKSGAAKEAATRTVIDHDDESVVIPAKVNRAVVVGVWPLPSVITVFLGSPDRLVGIPPASIGAAKAGLLGELFPSYLNIDSHFLANDTLNVEEVLALKPDVVFTTAHRSQQKEEIKKAGLAAVAVSVNKWNYNILDTYDGWIDVLSQVFPENDKKDAVSAYSRKVYETIQSRVSSIPENDRKKVLFLFMCNEKTIVTSGKRFFGQFWCDAVGAKNVAEEVGAENSNAVINMEQIYKWNPDIILITNFTSQTADDLYNNRTANYDWSPIKAVQNRTVYKMPLGTYRSYTPSADTPVTLYWIAKKVYPELFGDIDVEKEVKSYFKDMYNIDLTDEQINRMYNQDSKGAAGTRGA